MYQLFRTSIGLGLCGLIFTFQGVARAADADSCTAIASAPFTISAPGSYCVTKDISTSITGGNAITVSANNVQIDLGGHSIGNLAAGPSTNAIGIWAQSNSNIAVRNGTLRGFKGAIFLNLSDGSLVEDIRTESSTFYGIVLNGAGGIVRHNLILNSGGTTFAGAGIELGGDGARVLDNDVVNTLALSTGGSTGISLCQGNATIAEGNRVSNQAAAVNGGNTTGIEVCGQGTADALVVNNRIARMSRGVAFDGLSGKFRDNLTVGVTTPYQGGTDAGNNQ